MKKVFINKNYSVAEVVEKIISEPELEIVLVIPKGTIFSDSPSDFKLIKREADGVGKNIIVESVDEGVLSSAKASHIEAIHPLLKKKHSSLSDIVKRTSDESDDLQNNRQDEDEETEGFDGSDEEESENLKPRLAYGLSKIRKVSSGSGRKKFLWIAIPIVLIIGAFYVLSFFKKADVVINFKPIPFSHGSLFTVNAGIQEIDAEKGLIPGEVFTDKKNITQTFAASSRRNVSLKATGKIKVYNSFSSDPQALVATTRFLTDDGKIYRLDKTITVPGAEIKDGQIIPAFIEADVTADKAGPEYNSAAISRLSIPGFKGSPKYEKFYGSLVSATGGFIGEKAVPNESDISNAKEKINQTLKTSFTGDVSSVLPDDFKVIEGASQIKVVRTSINSNTDDAGKFSAFGEAEFQAIGFREEDLKAALLEIAKVENPHTIFKNLALTYKLTTVNFDKGSFSFDLTAEGALTQEFDVDKFKAEISGQNIAEVRAQIQKLPGLSDAKVSIWPSWFKKLPTNSNRIKIQVD